MNSLRLVLAFHLALWAAAGQAVIAAYPFEDDAMRERYTVLIAELRCPKCQNQNLADSNAPIAKDMRDEVYRLLHEGYSDRQIEDHLVERYGEFVLYRPRVNQHTLVLWLAPAIMLLMVAAVVVLMLRRRAIPPQAAGKEAAKNVADILQQQEESR